MQDVVVHRSDTPIGRPNTMDHPVRRLGTTALALAAVAALLMTSTPVQAAPEFAPATVDYGLPSTVKGQFLSYNDFHGAIDPPSGSGAVVNAGGTSTPAGGVEYLATYLKKLRAEAATQGRPTTTV